MLTLFLKYVYLPVYCSYVNQGNEEVVESMCYFFFTFQVGKRKLLKTWLLLTKLIRHKFKSGLWQVMGENIKKLTKLE